MPTPPRFVTDEKGQRIAVQLDIADYERMLEELEDREDVRLYDEAKASNEQAIPLEQAIEQIERRKK